MSFFHHNQKGFTLIEMIVALSIFTVTVLVATNVYLLISNTQQRTLAAQKILDDVRALFETISQETRLGTINYEYYDTYDIDLHPSATDPVQTLAIIDQAGSQIFFRLETDTVQYCEEVSGTDCDPMGDGWIDITPVGVTVEKLNFVITPSADPFTATSEVSCALTDCQAQGLTSYRCAADGVCRYYDNDGHLQPQVQMLIKSTALAPRLIEQASVTMQTIITSRIIEGTLENIYHE